MDLSPSPVAAELEVQLEALMDEGFSPALADPYGPPRVVDDFPLVSMSAHVRNLRLADAPDEVHRGVVARRELRPWEPR
jgi:hypothetical protein